MRALLVLFLLSGAVGLGYQVLWSRWLLQSIGASAPAHAVVLAAFMGGLALGARLLGPLADRLRRPLRLYAVLELGLAGWALAWPFLAGGLEAALGASLGLEGPAALAARASVAGLLLLPPTVAMGATWPAVTRHAVRGPAQLGRRASGLYAANAAGAVLGALTMAYFLLPALGLRGGLLLMAGLNVLLAGAAWWMAEDVGEAAGEAAEAAGTTTTAEPAGPVLPAAVLGLVLFLAGSLSFVHEIAWTRLLSIGLGSSTHSFAVMLASFVAGIAGGSALLARFDHRVRCPLLWLGWTQLGSGLFVWLVLPAGAFLPWAFGRLATLLTSGIAQSYALQELAKAVASGAVLFPLALLVGVSVPLALKAVARGPEGLARQAGRVYAANTWGNVVGALAAGLLLLPLLGMERLLFATAAGSVLLGLALLLRVGGSRRSLSGGLVAAAAALAWALLAGGWNAAWFTLTPARHDMPPLERARAFVASWEVLHEADDPAGHVLVAQVRDREPPYRVLFVNGKPDASSGDDMPTQALLAHLPLVLHPDARDVMVIGLASGVTAGAALEHPIDSLEVVDLAGATAEVVEHFAEWNGRPLEDLRTRFVVDDGRNRILHGSSRHDVIISEPSNPWVAGIGSLFSVEFYEAAASRLNDDGCFVQWLQAYELSDETLVAVVRSFRSVFPHVRAFNGAGRDLLLVGRLSPLEPDWGELRSRAARPAVAEDLAQVRVSSLEDLLRREMLSPPTIDWLAAQSGLLNTDDNLLLEHRAPRDLFARASPERVGALDERPLHPPSRLIAGLPRTGEAPPPPELPRGGAETVAWLTANGARALEAVSVDRSRGADWARAVEEAVSGADDPGARAAWGLFRVDLLFAAGRVDEGLEALGALRASEPLPSPEVLLLRACRSGRDEACDEAIDAEGGRLPAAVLERFRALRGRSR